MSRIDAAITILPSSDLRFGGHVDYSCSVPLGFDTQVYLQVVQGGMIVCSGYSSTFADGKTTFVLGPTPSWSSGAAEGSLALETLNRRTGQFVKTKTSVAFAIAA